MTDPDVPPPNATKAGDFQPQITAEQVRLLYAQAMPGFVATLINTAIFTVVLWGVVDQGRLTGWLIYMVCVTAMRYLLTRRYARTAPAQRSRRHWRQAFLLGAALSGAGWGVAGTLLFPTTSVVHQMFVLIVLAGMAAGAVPFLSSVQSVYLAYLLPALLPVGFFLLVRPDPPHEYIGAMALLFLGMLILTGRRIHANLTDSLRLRFENQGLVANLSDSTAELQDINRKLRQEVAARMRTERQLRDSGEFLERIMETATNAICVLDLGGHLVRANQALEILTGRDVQALSGTPLAHLFVPRDRERLNALLSRAAEGGETVRQQTAELEGRRGQVRTVLFSLAPLREEDETAAVVGTVEDITERMALERMKDEFMSTVSHELRTPLTSIRGSLRLLRGGIGQVPDQVRSLAEIADSNCDRLLNLIDDLLDVQRLEAAAVPFEFRRYDVAALVQAAIDSNGGYAQQLGITLRFDPRGIHAQVRVDRERFLQVMNNLLSNAAKFSPAGGTVEVELARRGGRVRIAVTDHGPGIPEAFRQRVFDRFAQADASSSRSRGGTGLGLNIAKGFVERMGGRIGFDSAVGRGTTFRVDLPVAQESVEDG